jgi:hypothetical protein
MTRKLKKLNFKISFKNKKKQKKNKNNKKKREKLKKKMVRRIKWKLSNKSQMREMEDKQINTTGIKL